MKNAQGVNINNNNLMHVDDIKLFAKDKKKESEIYM